MNVLPEIQFFAQPNGYTCGTTALYTACDALGVKTPDILTLADEMGTNPKTGTTDKEMERGLEIVKLPVLRYAKRKDGSLLTTSNNVNDVFLALTDCLDRNEAFLLRTLMGGYHWVLVYGYHDDIIHYMCSCMGHQEMDKQTLFNVWAPRQFDGFRIPV